MPQQFGAYELLAKLATGGMGEVFLARHCDSREGFEKLVVLKRVLPHLMDQQRFVRMFQHEARIAARINHTHVCQTFELGSAEGVYYMTMEYLEGLPFNQVIKRRKQDGRLGDLRLMGRFVMQAAEGLHAAHTLCDEDGELVHVVHRDVCHSNIFITSGGVAKLLDFGVAKARGAMEKTRTGVVKGTYAYSAPEQLRGEQVDARADIFGLGIVTWEAVTGRRLFRRDTDFLVFRAINEEPIPNVRSVRSDVPELLASVIDRALSRDRDARYETARAFGLAVGDAVQALGPPLSSVAVATLLESAFAEELEEQRRLCRLVEEERETLENIPPVDRFSDPSITKPFQADHVARIVGALPLTADTEELPAIFEGFSDFEDAPDFEVTPVDDGITYSAMTPMPQLRRRASTASTATEPSVTPAPDESAVGDHGARAMTDVDEPVGQALAHEAVPLLRPSGRRTLVTVLAIACVIALAGVGFVATRDDGQRAARPAASPAMAAPTEARLHGEIETAVVVVEPAARALDAGVAGAVAESSAVGPADAAAEPDAGAGGAIVAEGATPDAGSGATVDRSRDERRPVRQPRRVERRPAAKPGYATIDAKPYATVWIDGKKVGVTPVVRLELAPGTHRVRAVSSADGAERRFEIKVLSGKATRKKISW